MSYIPDSKSNRLIFLWRKASFALLTCLFSFSVYADERQLTTLALQNQLPSQVLPVIRPLLSTGSTATEFNNQLILNVTDSELAKIKQLLGAIDQRPRQLMITVQTPGSSSSSNRSVDIDGRIGNDNISIGTGKPLRGDNLRVRVDNSNSREITNGQQQVRAVEGMPAQISIGVTTPVTNSYTTIDGRRVINREYYPVNQSVSVIARVVDNRVILDIDQQNNQLDGNQNPSRSGQIVQRRSVPITGERYDDRNRYSRDIYDAPTIQTQSISTQVSGRIGEWIPLGGIDQSGSGSSSGFSSTGSNSRSETSSVLIKVDVLEE